jgi:hypothetical protein
LGFCTYFFYGTYDSKKVNPNRRRKKKAAGSLWKPQKRAGKKRQREIAPRSKSMGLAFMSLAFPRHFWIFFWKVNRRKN